MSSAEHRPAGASAGALVVVGPTATGKSALALAVARLAGDVEVISADSMQVYRGMDIGTAKASLEEQAEIAHHLIDVVDIDHAFSVSDYQRLARAALADLAERSKRALLVGGTGLYVQAMVDDLQIPGQYPAVRAELEADADTAGLHERLRRLDPTAAGRMEPTNRRRVVRALEVTLGSGRPFSAFGPGIEHHGPVAHVLVGLTMDRAALDARIEARYHRQLAAGFLEEVRTLSERGPHADGSFGLSPTAAQALGYRELLGHLRGECSLEEAVQQAVVRTRQFARRQERWFRRDPRIRWIDAEAVAENPMATARTLLEDWSRHVRT